MLIDKGVRIHGFNDDLYGTAPDIGFFEFTTPTPVPTPVAVPSSPPVITPVHSFRITVQVTAVLAKSPAEVSTNPQMKWLQF